MKIHSIASDTNSTVKTIRALHKRQVREKEQLFLLEGSHCLGEAVQKQLDLKAIVASRSYLNEHIDELEALAIEQISVVEDKLFAELASTANSCGVLAIGAMPRRAVESVINWRPRVFAIADAIQDPGNLGTLIRTAFAAQLGGLILLKGCVDAYNPKVVRAAAGALFALPLVADIEASTAVKLLKSNGIKIIVCEANAQQRYFEAKLADSVAIVLGNEGNGPGELIRAAADESISIPMNPQSESLNVAISGGIILFETLKQRLAVANR